MKTPISEKFLTYYQRELSYLRHAGHLFSIQHPKIARRLQLSQNESPDPHIERLLESFAFLTAQLNQEIEDRLPQISAALLGVLYPHLTNPVPSMTIAQFVGDPSKGKMTSGFDIPKHTPLFTYAQEGVTCRFRTSYPVTLWPIDIAQVDFVEGEEYQITNGIQQKKWYLRLRLQCHQGVFSDLSLKTLRIHIAGDRSFAFSFYQCLFAQTDHQVLQSTDGKSATLFPPLSLKQVGFNREEMILPTSDHSHLAYQTLHEYFHFSEKFLFFDIDNLHLQSDSQTADLLIGIEDEEWIGKKTLNPSFFKLGCTPIVNLFPKITDPLRLDHRQFDYRLVPDQRRERTTEIYSIDKVTSTVDQMAECVLFNPYFSFHHWEQKNPHSIYWLSRRIDSKRPDVPGTETVLSFVDLGFNPKLPPQHTVFAHTLCTNRFLPEQIPSHGVFQLEDRAPISTILCLKPPTAPIYSPQEGETLWQLISHLSINHLSLTCGESSLHALKETLRLYARMNQNYHHTEIEWIEKLTTTPVIRRVIGREAHGFIHGLQLTMTMNEQSATGGSIWLLASVLRHFFTLHISINSFIEMQLNSTQRKGHWMKWHPLHGDQLLL